MEKKKGTLCLGVRQQIRPRIVTLVPSDDGG